jgi:hypothetical protein
MTEGVGGGGLGKLRGHGGLAHGPLDDRFVQVMTADFASVAVHIGAGRGEEPLPDPFPAGVRVLARERLGQGHGAGASGQVGQVAGFHFAEVQP